MYITFAIIAAPFLFFMTVWALVSVYRILSPEEPAPFEQDPVMVRRRLTSSGLPTPVGVREIREDQRLRRLETVGSSYHYDAWSLLRHKVPSAWMDELWLRRN